MTRITDALTRHRDRVRNGEEGFTLIELLVVVIIIGILAAIAIPVYIGVQNNAKDSAVRSDLNNAKTAVVAWYTDSSNTTAPTLSTAALGEYGFSLSAENYSTQPAFDGTPTSTAFCIEATSVTGNQFHVDQTNGVDDGGC